MALSTERDKEAVERYLSTLPLEAIILIARNKEVVHEVAMGIVKEATQDMQERGILKAEK